uniref:G domain-containing protein n=1 Tax=Callorhinchus milii TaxID=7868 RepID=A0A4W3GE41_CALMI
MKRSLVLVLNKVDLAPASVVIAWKHYFQKRFPQLHVLSFTSSPRDPQDIRDPSTVFQRRRRRRRGRRAALGPEQLLGVCETLTQGKGTSLTPPSLPPPSLTLSFSCSLPCFLSLTFSLSLSLSGQLT